jgi:tRNA threonylcarbamoyladenosine biosynthesis protein TsaB
MTLLHIDTATEYAGTCISKDGVILGKKENKDPKNHGAFLQPAIQLLCEETGIALPSIDAVSVTAGPGSYTGIRVAMASAKGICFALNKPLIAISTLAVIAESARLNSERIDDFLIYPMIDARRMEVFMGVYNAALEELKSAHSFVIQAHYLQTLPTEKHIIFCGNGAGKIPLVTTPLSYAIYNQQHQVENLVPLAENAFKSKKFADLAYIEPLYAKDFYDNRK